MSAETIQLGKRALATTSDLAKHLQVTTRTVQNWRKSGRIPFLRITARSLRYDIDQVERALTR